MYLNDDIMTIWAWGCGKSDRRVWLENSRGDVAINGRLSLEGFVELVVENGIQQEAIAANLVTQTTIDDWISRNQS